MSFLTGSAAPGVVMAANGASRHGDHRATMGQFIKLAEERKTASRLISSYQPENCPSLNNRIACSMTLVPCRKPPSAAPGRPPARLRDDITSTTTTSWVNPSRPHTDAGVADFSSGSYAALPSAPSPIWVLRSSSQLQFRVFSCSNEAD